VAGIDLSGDFPIDAPLADGFPSNPEKRADLVGGE
jgi:hypothetical protein